MFRYHRIVRRFPRHSALHARSHLLLCVTLSVTAALRIIAHFVGVNTSASSTPVGLYLRTAPRPGRGKLVEVCLPSAAARLGIKRGYISHSWRCADGSEPVGKVIAGMPGDLIDIDPATVLRVDSAGRPLTHFPFGKYRLKAGEMWLYGAARNSFDSRYFGSVPVKNVIASLSPLITW